MRASKTRAAQNHQQMLTAATRLLKERGIHATGVDAIITEAGLTHSGLYSQFRSKEAIVTEAIRAAVTRSKRLWQTVAKQKSKGEAFREIVERYLSTEHRDAHGQGCVVAALGADIARQPPSIRDAFTKEFVDGIKFLAELTPGADPAQRCDSALAAFTNMVGALILARAVNDEALSQRILHATAQQVTQRTKAQKPLRRTKGRR
jgi:TetR/AcrR family transcriptional repressor of nem operon